MSDKRTENLAKIRAMGEKIAVGNKLQHTIEVNFVSENGNHYEGNIVVHRPSMGDYIKMGVEKAKYLQKQMGVDENGMPVQVNMHYIDPGVRVLAHTLGTLSVVVDKCPEWFLYPEELTDYDVLDHVFTQYEVWLDSFRNRNRKQADGDSEQS